MFTIMICGSSSHGLKICISSQLLTLHSPYRCNVCVWLCVSKSHCKVQGKYPGWIGSINPVTPKGIGKWMNECYFARLKGDQCSSSHHWHELRIMTSLRSGKEHAERTPRGKWASFQDKMKRRAKGTWDTQEMSTCKTGWRLRRMSEMDKDNISESFWWMDSSLSN